MAIRVSQSHAVNYAASLEWMLKNLFRRAGICGNERIARARELSFVLVIICAGVVSSCQNNTDGQRRVPMPQQQTRDTATPISGPIRYVALGDSTGVGVGARNGGYVIRMFRHLTATRSDSTLTNLCENGATTSDVIRTQLEPGIEADPNLVTLAIGINDIGHGVDREQFARNYEQILVALKSRTSARIIVANIPDISSAPRIPELMRSEYQQQITQFNASLEEVAARQGVKVFDVFTLTQRELRSHPEYFSADGFHPSDLGYELWAEQMWPVLAEMVGIHK